MEKKKEISNDSKNVAIQGEYIACYSRNQNAELKFEDLSGAYIEESYNEPNSDYPEGKWRPVPITVSKGLSGGGYEYQITTPTGMIHDRVWAYPEESYKQLLENNRIYFGKNENGVPQRIIYAHESVGQPVSNYWQDIATNKEGKKEILDLFSDKVFDTPKPTDLVIKMMKLILDQDDLVLDFFSGSSTTAHAVMKLNAEDGGDRKYILTQLQEPTPEESEARRAGYENIAELGRERIKRAGVKIKEEFADKLAGREIPLDIGFRTYRLTSSTFNTWDVTSGDDLQGKLLRATSLIKADASDEDVLAELILKSGYGLSESVSISDIHGVQAYTVTDNNLVIVLKGSLTEQAVRAIAELSPKRFIAREDVFADDASLTNTAQIMKDKGIDFRVL